MLYRMETWKESTAAISHDISDILASHGEDREMRRAYCHALPVKITISRQ